MKIIQNQTSENNSYQLVLAEGDVPNPLPHQVLIKVNAFGINRADILQAQGHYPAPKGHSEILGLEVSGEIAELGNKVSGWQTGQRVCCLVSGGGYAQYAVVDARHLINVPDDMSDHQAAGIAEVFLTAYQAMFSLGMLSKQQRVLIHAGASGVGLAATQLAKLHNCHVSVTSSSSEKLQVCANNGADLLINYKKQDFVEVLKQQGLQHQINLVIDVVGADYVNRNLSVMAMDATLVQLAMLGGRYSDKFDLANLLAKRIRFIGSTLRNRSDDYKAQLVMDFTQKFGQALNSGQLNTNLYEVLSVNEINQAHQVLSQNKNAGKVVVSWD
ncbi:NAD(P)H-quinone oxidoreductase [Neptunicella marina]|uniref:NAD(P)H-quinone oxidoreductase n=1 Tax=Neptunicella marina TaxID=2125989 RepID=A0A8J6M0Q9_9ALTE|nr:NAD(P)H-quinone oxidoreductase [Neptunicella marina]MBC3767334.1 NAD(P)H-quinone oxidoreductase [Neptunicella marina]